VREGGGACEGKGREAGTGELSEKAASEGKGGMSWRARTTGWPCEPTFCRAGPGRAAFVTCLALCESRRAC